MTVVENCLWVTTNLPAIWIQVKPEVIATIVTNDPIYAVDPEV